MSEKVNTPASAEGAPRKIVSYVRLSLLAVSASLAIWYGFLYYSAPDAGQWIKRYGYFTMSLTLGWWLWSLWRVSKQGVAARVASECANWKRHRWVAALIAGLMLIACVSVPYSYKVLNDELVLQTTAYNQHFHREVGALVKAYEVGGQFKPVTSYLDKRPFFYAYTVALAHDLTGYRIENAFVLNTGLMVVALALLYLIAMQLAGRRAAVVAVAFFGTSALLAHNANGAGMELLNVVMLLMVTGLGIYYLKDPEEDRLAALVLGCVLFAQTRYESALFVVPVALIVLEGWRRAGRVIIPVAAWCAPLLLVPCALHNVYLSGTPLLWELRDDVAARFEWKYVAGNLGHAWAYFFDFSLRLLSAWWLYAAGFAAGGWGLWKLWKARRAWRRPLPEAVVVVLIGLAVLANLGLLMFYFWGQLDDPIVSRLILPFNVVLALVIAWAAQVVENRWGKPAWAWMLAVPLLCYLAFGLTGSAHNLRINQLASEIEWEGGWVNERPVVPRLVITNKTVLHWIIQETPALSTSMARDRGEQIRFHMEAGTFREVLVMQYLRPLGSEGGFAVDPADRLPEEFVLEPLHERQIGGRLLRISRLVKVTQGEGKKTERSAEVSLNTRSE